MSFRIHYHHVTHSDSLREQCERLAEGLRDEFPEAQSCEVSLQQNGTDREVIVHVTGKELDVASRARAMEFRDGVHDAFERVRRQLRTHHDKLVFRGRHK
jgi:ribosome-associated translation inhibitor RaiA